MANRGGGGHGYSSRGGGGGGSSNLCCPSYGAESAYMTCSSGRCLWSPDCSLNDSTEPGMEERECCRHMPPQRAQNGAGAGAAGSQFYYCTSACAECCVDGASLQMPHHGTCSGRSCHEYGADDNRVGAADSSRARAKTRTTTTDYTTQSAAYFHQQQHATHTHTASDRRSTAAAATASATRALVNLDITADIAGELDEYRPLGVADLSSLCPSELQEEGECVEAFHASL